MGGFVALEVIPTKCFSIVMMIREAPLDSRRSPEVPLHGLHFTNRSQNLLIPGNLSVVSLSVYGNPTFAIIKDVTKATWVTNPT